MSSQRVLPPLGPSSPPWRVVAAVWGMYGVVYSVLWSAAAKPPFFQALPSASAGAFAVAATWALLTPVIFQLARIVRPARLGWPASIVVHAVAAIFCGMLVTFVRRETLHLFPDYWMAPFLPEFFFWLDVWLFVYLSIVAVGNALGVRRRYVDRSIRAHLLETQLARAQLQYLEIQLQPHFLFNALNSIQELAHESSVAAERMLRRLHALLSISLDRSGQDEVTVTEEIAALEPYLDIQRTRFSDWLSVDVRIGAGAENALVPHLILQPLVENAIRHGLSVRPGPGRIVVSAERSHERLILKVQDDGVGLRKARNGTREGIGLRNAGERLRQLYGEDHRFELRDAPNGGVIVELELPYHPGVATSPDRLRFEMDRNAGLMAMEDIQAWRTGEYSTNAYPPIDPTPAVATYGSIPPRPARLTKTNVAIANEGVPNDEAATVTAANVTTSGAYTVDDPEPSWSPSLSRRAWLGIVAMWCSLTVFWTYQMVLVSATRRVPKMTSPIGDIVRLQAPGSVIWLLMSPLVFWLARRFRIDSSNWRWRLPLHVAVAVATGFIHTGLMWATGITMLPVLSAENLNPLTGDFFVYFGLLAWSHSRDFVAWYRARELESARLSSRIALSRFQSLRVQLRPQFLLSTLDLLAELVHHDVPRTERLIARLADTLRLTLDLGRESTTTVAQELDLLQACVEAHRVGIRPGVQLELDVPPSTLALRIPSRLLCTMVDELLASDAANPATPLTVRVEIERVHDTTRIRLQGDALWLGGRSEPHAWWRAKSVAEAAVEDAGALVSLTFPDRATAVLIVADDDVAAGHTYPGLVAAGA